MLKNIELTVSSKEDTSCLSQTLPASAIVSNKKEILKEEALYNIEERKWKSCCFQLEPESSLFFGKIGISLSVICLCSYQLITLKDCSYQSLYSSLLSSVITFWLTKK